MEEVPGLVMADVTEHHLSLDDTTFKAEIADEVASFGYTGRVIRVHRSRHSGTQVASFGYTSLYGPILLNA